MGAAEELHMKTLGRGNPTMTVATTVATMKLALELVTL